MFDIKIGTCIDAINSLETIPVLNPKGFESYELFFGKGQIASLDFEEFSKKVNEVKGDAVIGALGFYKNPIIDEGDRAELIKLIENAHYFGCDTIGAFAGGDPSLKNIEDNIPLFKKVWEPIVKLAEDKGVKIGFENCAGGGNIACLPYMWERMFDAIDSKNLGLEWEPAHALGALRDPIAEVRFWAKKVVHLHGKDGTNCKDLIAKYGINGLVPWHYDRTPGFGDTNWADIFTILLYNGFKGSCDIEGYHDLVHFDDMEWTGQLVALDYLKRCRGGLEYFYGPEKERGYQGNRRKKLGLE